MGDAQPTFLAVRSGTEHFIPATPSGLTPNTRSEAEAALSLNSSTQTDSAAPTTPLPHTQNMFPGMGAGGGNTLDQEDQTMDEAKRAYNRPPGIVRTSSSNYAAALAAAHQESSASSNFSTDTTSTETTSNTNITGTQQIASPTSATSAIPFPPPGQGVVPLHPGVGAGQAEALKRVRPTGLSLGSLGRQQSWSEQDMKHIYSGALMREVKGDAGYGSGAEGKEA